MEELANESVVDEDNLPNFRTDQSSDILRAHRPALHFDIAYVFCRVFTTVFGMLSIKFVNDPSRRFDRVEKFR